MLSLLHGNVLIIRGCIVTKYHNLLTSSAHNYGTQ